MTLQKLDKQVIFLAIVGIASATAGSMNPASGAILTYDRVIYEADDSLDPAKLSGQIEMSYDSSANVLTISLQNTSQNITGLDGSKVLLSGLGFNLPSGLAPVFSGTKLGANNVTAGSGSTLVNFPSGADLNQQWGYDFVDGGISSGNHFASGEPKMGALEVNTSIGSHQNDMRNVKKGQRQTFAGEAEPSASPDYGLLSDNQLSFGGGQAAVQDSVTISMLLSGSYMGELIDAIDDNDMVLMFGSADTAYSQSPPPTTIDGVPTPEPATIFVWSALFGCAALLGWRRRRTG